MLLERSIVYSHRSTPDLDTIQDKVIMLATDLGRDKYDSSRRKGDSNPHRIHLAFIQRFDILPHWGSERVMRTTIPSLG